MERVLHLTNVKQDLVNVMMFVSIINEDFAHLVLLKLNNGIDQYINLMEPPSAAWYLVGLNNRHVLKLKGFPAVISRFRPDQMDCQCKLRYIGLHKS